MKASYYAAFAMILLIVAMEAPLTMSVTCSVGQLFPCAAAMLSSAPPSAACCNRLFQQRPCLCKYMRDPNLQKYINSANAKKVARTCRVGYPRC